MQLEYYSVFIAPGDLYRWEKLLRTVTELSDATDQLMVKYLEFASGKNVGVEGKIHQLFITLEKAYDSVRRCVT
jgi:hypothetical protein